MSNESLTQAQRYRPPKLVSDRDRWNGYFCDAVVHASTSSCVGAAVVVVMDITNSWNSVVVVTTHEKYIYLKVIPTVVVVVETSYKGDSFI